MAITTGSKVRIPKGIAITGTFIETKKMSKRSQVVVVDHILDAHSCPDCSEGRSGPLHPAKVVWAGSGGYWYEAPIDLVEELPDGQ